MAFLCSRAPVGCEPVAIVCRSIRQNVVQVLSELPHGIELVAAAKTRSPAEIIEAVEAGITIVGENYVQEAETAYKVIGNRAKWHFIGHLQRNKVKRAVRIFDMVETIDSVDIAREVDKKCAQIGKTMPVLIEVNSGRERQKSGVFPEDVAQLAMEISAFPSIRVTGLMTMGPRSGDPEGARRCFAATKRVFEDIRKLNLPAVEMKYLSMGMTDSYQTAIEEGANIVRLGTKIFGDCRSTGQI